MESVKSLGDACVLGKCCGVGADDGVVADDTGRMSTQYGRAASGIICSEGAHSFERSRTGRAASTSEGLSEQLEGPSAVVPFERPLA